MEIGSSPSTTTNPHNLKWGQWVKARAALVGFNRSVDLAKAVGCSYFSVHSWVNAVAPRWMRMGYVDALAAALRVDGEILFKQWRTIAPDQAPVLDKPKTPVIRSARVTRRKIAALTEILSPAQLEELIEAGRDILARGRAD